MFVIFQCHDKGLWGFIYFMLEYVFTLKKESFTNFHISSFHYSSILSLISAKKFQIVRPKVYFVFDILRFRLKRCISFSNFLQFSNRKSDFSKKRTKKGAGFLCSSNAVEEFYDFGSMFDFIISNIIRRTKWHCKFNSNEKLI